MNPLRRFWRHLCRPLDPPAQGLEEQQLADYERGKAALLARLVHDRPDKVNLPPGPHVGKTISFRKANSIPGVDVEGLKKVYQKEAEWQRKMDALLKERPDAGT